MAEDKSKVSFLSKTSTICPVCTTKFRKEELLSGGGRMNAGKLTDELHRLFIATHKYGSVYPLLYPVAVCPTCLYSTYLSDFTEISPEAVTKLKNEKALRIKEAKNLFPDYDFTKTRISTGCNQRRAPIIINTLKHWTNAL